MDYLPETLWDQEKPWCKLEQMNFFLKEKPPGFELSILTRECPGFNFEGMWPDQCSDSCSCDCFTVEADIWKIVIVRCLSVLFLEKPDQRLPHCSNLLSIATKPLLPIRKIILVLPCFSTVCNITAEEKEGEYLKNKILPSSSSPGI